jgi:hypothetical protein
LVTYDANDPDTSCPPIAPLRPPVGVPNVLVVLLDGTGFDASSTFGEPIRTVSDDYAAGDTRFNGRVRWVQIDIDAAAEDLDHLITPAERLTITMARQ